MRGLILLPRIRRGLRNAFEALCLGMTVVSLVVQPVFAADLKANKLAPPSPATPRAWNQPLSEDEKISHLLSRITFGPRADDIERVRRMGLEGFLDGQLHPERIDDSAVEARLAALPTLKMSTEELFEKYPRPNMAERQARQRSADSPRGSRPEQPRDETGEKMRATRQGMADMQGPRRVIMELAQQEVFRAVYSNRQLQELMVQFWMNHFNIFAGKGADRWLMTSFERDTIRPRALGRFEDLLVATAESPAMLFYLDNWMSSTPNPTYSSNLNGRPGQADLMSAHGERRSYRFFGMRRRGLFGLGRIGRGVGDNRRTQNPSGEMPRPGRPGAASPQNRRRGLNENYARELMELHTLGVDGGYTQKDVIEVARCFTGWTISRPRQGGGFVFNPRMHDFGEKVVLDRKIPSGQGKEDGLTVLHLLASHPSTARFISLKLAQRFVADDPPPSVVERASGVFLKTQGDLRAVLGAILTSPEFYSQAAYRAKVKSPLELVASSLRALGGETDAGVPLLMGIARMGQPMFQYQAPTGIPDQASSWISSSTLLMRLRFAMIVATNRIPGTQVELKEFERAADETSWERVLKDLAQRLVGGKLSPETPDAILSKVSGNNQTGRPDSESPSQASIIAGLLLASPEFQRR